MRVLLAKAIVALDEAYSNACDVALRAQTLRDNARQSNAEAAMKLIAQALDLLA